MDYSSWAELEEDINELIEQTMRGEPSIGPGISRVLIEFHLAPPDDLPGTSPTPLLEKLMVVLIVNQLLAEADNSPDFELSAEIAQLLGMINQSDMLSLDQASLEQIRAASAHLPDSQQEKLARLLG